MASVDLTRLRIRSAVPIPVTFGGVQRSELGGSSQFVGGLGNRWGFSFETPPMLIEPEGRLLLVDLTRGLREGVLVRVQQPDFERGGPGSPTVRTATASGDTIPIEGASPNAVIKKGFWLNYFDAAGNRYLEQTSAQVIVDADGEADLPLQNLLRAPLAEGANIELIDPCIDGTIEGDFGGGWGTDRLTSYSFTVLERR